MKQHEVVRIQTDKGVFTLRVNTATLVLFWLVVIGGTVACIAWWLA